MQADRRMVDLTRPVRCDVLEFLRRAAEDPSGAATMDVPAFLAGFSIRHAPRFDDWAADTRAHLLHRYTGVLEGLARDAIQQRRWRDAMAYADRWLACDPLSEAAARLAIEARYLGGDRGASLACFAEYRRALGADTGCEPSHDLLALVRRIESDERPAPQRPGQDEWFVRAPSLEASLIGRGAEWKALSEAWNAAAAGARRVVLVEGEAGVGKSRLMDEFLRTAVAEGATVLRGRGYDATVTVPFAPMVEVLHEALPVPGLAGTDAEWLAEVARLLPELRQRFPGLPEPESGADHADVWRLYEGVAQLLASLAAERPVVVAVDDLQWCDEDSCKLIHFLTRRLDRGPILWIAAITLGELERDAPAARLCRSLRAKSGAETVALAGLGEEEVWRLVRELGHVSTPTGGRRFAGRLRRITGGNPFFVFELIKTMFDQGLLAVDEGTGEWTAAPAALESGREFPLSRTVHDTIAERVDRLPADLGDILVTIAVAGGAGCRPEILSHVHGISRLHAATACDTLVERRVLVEDAGVYRCLHPMIAGVVRDRLTPTLRREVHRALAFSLEEVTPQAECWKVAGDLARHAEEGGVPELAYRSALLASEAAVRRFAVAEALSWLDLASSVAMDPAASGEVDRRTMALLESAGWSEASLRGRARPPAMREIVSEDLDLPVRG